MDLQVQGEARVDVGRLTSIMTRWAANVFFKHVKSVSVMDQAVDRKGVGVNALCSIWMGIRKRSTGRTTSVSDWGSRGPAGWRIAQLAQHCWNNGSSEIGHWRAYLVAVVVKSSRGGKVFVGVVIEDGIQHLFIKNVGSTITSFYRSYDVNELMSYLGGGWKEANASPRTNTKQV